MPKALHFSPNNPWRLCLHISVEVGFEIVCSLLLVPYSGINVCLWKG